MYTPHSLNLYTTLESPLLITIFGLVTRITCSSPIVKKLLVARVAFLIEYGKPAYKPW